MKELTKRDWGYIGLGGLLGAVLAPLAALMLNSMIIRPEPLVGAAQFVNPLLAERLSSTILALVLQSLLGALFGAVVLSAAIPLAENGGVLVAQSGLHFLATAGAFGLLLWGCGWVREPRLLLFWMGVLGVLYLLIWLGRWIGWYQEVVQLRTLLGLAPRPSPLRWRETLPYLPLVLLACGVLPPVLVWVDQTFVQDVPLFSGLLYPFLGLPIVCFCAGLSLGKRQGLCWLYPLACFLCYLPVVFWIFNSSALFHCFLAAVPALLGNVMGGLARRRSGGGT